MAATRNGNGDGGVVSTGAPAGVPTGTNGARRVIAIGEVEGGLVRVLCEHGVRDDDATIAARHLVEGAARGYLHHGVERIFEILDGFERGTLSPSARRRRIVDGPGLASLDAEHGLGAPAAAEAMGLALEKARNTGIAAVGVANAGHLGILAPWAELPAAAGMFGLVMTTTSPAVVVPGGRTAVLGTNPIAYAFPVEGDIVSVDFSTAATTRSTLLAHRESGEPLPLGLAVDERGVPTVDPEAALRGGLLPLGGEFKGALLSLLVAVLAGPAVGAAANHRVTGTRWMTAPPTKGDIFIAIDLGQLTDVAHFDEQMRSFFDHVEGDVPGVYVPGEGSQRRRVRAERHGIPVSARLAALLSPS
jgi:L-2-hydroxycarboxylate dehydrogenase (NAD+)